MPGCCTFYHPKRMSKLLIWKMKLFYSIMVGFIVSGNAQGSMDK